MVNKKKTGRDTRKRLYRSKHDQVIVGVCGGIGDYFNVDPVWPRLIAILLVFLDGVGILVYLILWILIPENPYQKKTKKSVVEEKIDYVSAKFHEKTSNRKYEEEVVDIEEDDDIEGEKTKMDEEINFGKNLKKKSEDGSFFIGSILFVIGVLFLLKQFYFPMISKIFWPVIIIVIGLLLLFRR